MDDKLKLALQRAVGVLRVERTNQVANRAKYEPNGNLYMLIEQESPAAIHKVLLIGEAIDELDQAIAYLERDL